MNLKPYFIRMMADEPVGIMTDPNLPAEEQFATLAQQIADANLPRPVALRMSESGRNISTAVITEQRLRGNAHYNNITALRLHQRAQEAGRPTRIIYPSNGRITITQTGSRTAR